MIQVIILHAGVDHRQLLVWGEDTALGARVLLDQAAQAQHYRAAPRPRPHPYASGEVGDIVARLMPPDGSGSAPVHSWGCADLKAYLPAANRLPLPSVPPPDDPPNGKRIKLAPFTVPAVFCHAGAAVELLLAVSSRKRLLPGVIKGEDLAFWGQALDWVLSLVARQRFLPALTMDGRHLHARWRPMLAGPDRAALRDLAHAMPAAAHTVVADGRPRAPWALAALEDYVGFTVDYIVRTSLTGAPLENLARSSLAHQAQRGRGAIARDIHNHWLAALHSETGLVEGKREELRTLAAAVEDWLRPVMMRAAAPYRLCFRLEEPDDESNIAGDDRARDRTADGARNGASADRTWHLRYLLQDAADPSLQFTAAQVWRGEADRLTPMRTQAGNLDPREYLLAGLGHAAVLCPTIETSLDSPAPGGIDLDTVGAHEFLQRHAPALEQAGFGVMLPAWWTGPAKVKVGVRARVRASGFQAAAQLGAESVVDFDWQLALGGETVTATELRELARLKVPLVRLRGRWMQLDAGEIRRALDFWRRRGQVATGTVLETVRMAMGTSALAGGLHLDGLDPEGPLADLLAQLDAQCAFGEIPLPRGFRGKLWPFQVRGYSWLDFLSRFGLGACLADDMGLGKTVQTLAFLQRRWEAGGQRPALLVCPTSVVGNWGKEAARFTPELPVLVHSGPERARNAASLADAVCGQGLVVTSYGLLQRDLPILAGIGWAGLILDEAQNIKNPEAKQARAARSLQAGFHVALTGTPVENNVGDLWSIMECLNPGLLGTQADFRRRFFLPIQVGRDAGAVRQLRRSTGPFILRRLKTDPTVLSDLPAKVEARVFCNLTREQASLYAAVVADLEDSLDELEGIERRGRILAALTRLKQVCNHPAHFMGDNSPLPGRSGKLARLAEMLEQALAAGDRALVFTQFTVMGNLLERFLAQTLGIDVLFLHGGVPRTERDRMVERFQAGGDEAPVFVLSLKAGGSGLNLTRANQVFHFDRWWNPAVENQATDRAYRIGQTRGVFVHKFVCLGTLEERIDELIERKRELSEGVVGSGEDWLSELSTAQLRELVALGPEAVRE